MIDAVKNDTVSEDGSKREREEMIDAVKNDIISEDGVCATPLPPLDKALEVERKKKKKKKKKKKGKDVPPIDDNIDDKDEAYFLDLETVVKCCALTTYELEPNNYRPKNTWEGKCSMATNAFSFLCNMLSTKGIKMHLGDEVVTTVQLMKSDNGDHMWNKITLENPLTGAPRVLYVDLTKPQIKECMDKNFISPDKTFESGILDETVPAVYFKEDSAVKLTLDKFLMDLEMERKNNMLCRLRGGRMGINDCSYYCMFANAFLDALEVKSKLT